MSDFNFRFQVTMRADAPDSVVVNAGPTEIIRVERKFGVGIGAVADLSTMRFEWLAYMACSAWYRLVKPGQPLDFDGWLDELVDLGIEADEVQGVTVEVKGDEHLLTREQLADAWAELERLDGVVRAVEAARAAANAEAQQRAQAAAAAPLAQTSHPTAPPPDQTTPTDPAAFAAPPTSSAPPADPTAGPSPATSSG